MKILVTGGCGFLGSNVCEYFAKRGHEVIALDNLTKHELIRTGYSIELARNLIMSNLKKHDVTLVIGDIRDHACVSQFKDVDLIVNTAAQPAMTIGIENPLLDFTTNVVGVFNLLEMSRTYDIPLLYCSTIHVYGNKINDSIIEGEKRFEYRPIKEDDELLGGLITPLHASKRSGEIYCQAYIDTYGCDIGIFRLTGIYGPNQFGSEDHGWVANFCIRNLTNKDITIFGSEKQVRDILYVSDVCKAIDQFSKFLKSGVFNVGGGKECAVSLIECIEMIQDITGKKSRIVMKPKRQGDLWFFVSDISKISRELDWKPTVFPREGLSKLISWIRENLHIVR